VWAELSLLALSLPVKFSRVTSNGLELQQAFLRISDAMHVDLRTAPALVLGAALITFCALRGLSDTIHVRLNEVSFRFAQELIEHSRFIPDQRNTWGEHRPSAEEENAFIRAHGIEEYAKWHLGIDNGHGQNTKARYKFPYGDFKTIHRSALLAARSRARQYGYFDIENAANRLLEMIELKGRNQRSDGPAAEHVSVQAVKNPSINSGKSSL